MLVTPLRSEEMDEVMDAMMMTWSRHDRKWDEKMMVERMANVDGWIAVSSADGNPKPFWTADIPRIDIFFIFPFGSTDVEGGQSASQLVGYSSGGP